MRVKYSEYSTDKERTAMQLELAHARGLTGHKPRAAVLEKALADDIVRYAALCKCVLDPHGFDNYKLWRVCDSAMLEDAVKDLDFDHGQDTFSSERYLLKQSEKIDFFACWPSIDKVVSQLSKRMGEDAAIDLINSCCINPTYLIKKGTKAHLLHPKDDAPSFIPPLTMPGAVGNQIKFQAPTLASTPAGSTPKSTSAALMLKILGGFIAALGALAVILALTILSPVSPIMVAAGVAGIIVGVGLFAAASKASQPKTPASALNLSV